MHKPKFHLAKGQAECQGPLPLFTARGAFPNLASHDLWRNVPLIVSFHLIAPAGTVTDIFFNLQAMCAGVSSKE